MVLFLVLLESSGAVARSPLVVELDLEEVLDVHLGHVVHDLSYRWNRNIEKPGSVVKMGKV